MLLLLDQTQAETEPEWPILANASEPATASPRRRPIPSPPLRLFEPWPSDRDPRAQIRSNLSQSNLYRSTLRVFAKEPLNFLEINLLSVLVQKYLQCSPFYSVSTPVILQNQTHSPETLVLHASPHVLGLILFRPLVSSFRALLNLKLLQIRPWSHVLALTSSFWLRSHQFWRLRDPRNVCSSFITLSSSMSTNFCVLQIFSASP